MRPTISTEKKILKLRLQLQCIKYDFPIPVANRLRQKCEWHFEMEIDLMTFFGSKEVFFVLIRSLKKYLNEFQWKLFSSYSAIKSKTLSILHQKHKKLHVSRIRFVIVCNLGLILIELYVSTIDDRLLFIERNETYFINLNLPLGPFGPGGPGIPLPPPGGPVKR